MKRSARIAVACLLFAIFGVHQAAFAEQPAPDPVPQGQPYPPPRPDPNPFPPPAEPPPEPTVATLEQLPPFELKLQLGRLEAENARLRRESELLADQNAQLKTQMSRLLEKNGYRLGGIGIGGIFNNLTGGFVVEGNISVLYGFYIPDVGGGGGLVGNIHVWKFAFRPLHVGVIGYHGAPLSAREVPGQRFAINFGTGVDFRFWFLPVGNIHLERLLKGLALRFQVEWFVPDPGAVANVTGASAVIANPDGTFRGSGDVYKDALRNPLYTIGLRWLF
jgi:hypothetical protein